MKISLKRVLYALIGILLVGIGIAFNSGGNLGNDPIGIVYDGFRNVLSLSTEQLGTASNYVNIVLIILLFFVGRKYVNIGTLIYILPYGLFVNFGAMLYPHLFASEHLLVRSFSVMIGCLLLYIGVAIFIAVDIGLDPFTGLVMVICDKVKVEYKKTKVVFDILMILIGVLLGGRLGVITIITALTAGPSIQYFSIIFKKHIKF